VIDPKVEHLRYAHAYYAAGVGRSDPAAALRMLHLVCDQLWPPATIITRYGARKANP